MKPLLYPFLFVFIISCQNPIDIELEKENIKAQFDLVTQAHFEKNANLFYQPNLNQWIDIRSGQITTREKKETILATQNYLDNMEFKQILTRDEPIIEISEDATLATYSNSATIKGLLNNEPVFWVVAWQSTVRKTNEDWKIISTVNTEATKAIHAKTLLNHVRDYMKVTDTIHSVYAQADCKGPTRDFKTLIMSQKHNGRMEQIYGDGHYLMKHGETSSWTYDFTSKTLTDSIDIATKTFIQGHELHWLSMWPEDRYTNPNFEGGTTFNDKKAFHISFINEAKLPVNFYYEFETYQPLGFDITPGINEEKVVISFNDFQNVDSILTFKKSTFKQGEETFEYIFKDIRFNDLKASDFESKEKLVLNNQ